jgi:fucose permease
MLVHGLRVRIGQDAYEQQQSRKPDFGFFQTKLFWLCAVILLCYLAVEGAIMGWLVTFFVDSGTAETTAQLLATALWGALLIGRFASAALSAYFKPYQMLLIMTAGVVLCFTVLLFSHSLFFMALSAMGLGLFMAGMYGTTLGGSEDLLERYPMCMGMFIAIPGVGVAATSSIVGVLADLFGIRGGMAFLYVLIAILVAASVLFAVYHSKKN